MQLVEQEPLWGCFGYSDLKGAALRSRSDVFSIGLRRVVWIAGLVLWTMWVGQVANFARRQRSSDQKLIGQSIRRRWEGTLR
jgi:hypothetical protein